MSTMPAEWGFAESPEHVDLVRLVDELSTLPAVVAVAYMEQLAHHAPQTYARLHRWAIENGRLGWVQWHAIARTHPVAP